MAGFTSGEGSFYFMVNTNSGYKSGFRVDIGFEITQHSRDVELMKSFISYFECGNMKKDNRTSCFSYAVLKLTDINEKIIPFFNKHKIEGVKSKSYEDWCKAAGIIKKRDHLIKEGIDQLLKLKNK